MCWYCLYWKSCPLPSDQSCLVRKSTELVNISMYIWNWKYSLQQSTINNQIRFDENSLVPNNDGTYKHTCSYSFIGRDIPCKANMTIPRTRHLKMLSVKIQNQELYPLIWFCTTFNPRCLWWIKSEQIRRSFLQYCAALYKWLGMAAHIQPKHQTMCGDGQLLLLQPWPISLNISANSQALDKQYLWCYDVMMQ